MNRVFLRNLKPVTCLASAWCVSLLEQGGAGVLWGSPAAPHVSRYAVSPSHGSPHALISQDGMIRSLVLQGLPRQTASSVPTLVLFLAVLGSDPGNLAFTHSVVTTVNKGQLLRAPHRRCRV